MVCPQKEQPCRRTATQPCLGPFDHELKTSKLSHAVLAGRRETAAKTGEMKSSQRNVRLEFAHDESLFMPRRMLRLVSLWLCIDIDLRHRQVLEMIFALVQYSTGHARSKGTETLAWSHIHLCIDMYSPNDQWCLHQRSYKPGYSYMEGIIPSVTVLAPQCNVTPIYPPLSLNPSVRRAWGQGYPILTCTEWNWAAQSTAGTQFMSPPCIMTKLRCLIT